MSDSEAKPAEAPVLDIGASADGRRNAYSSRCNVVDQVMNYAACQWRQNVLSAPDIRTPSDWACCSAAAREGRCQAVQMRREEELAGKAIYFIERRNGDNPLAVSPARRWIDNAWSGAKTAMTRLSDTARRTVATPAPAKPAAASALDAMGDMGDYADAISAAAAAPAVAPAPVAPPAVVRTASPMLPGESPLAYAKRIREEAAA